MHLKCTSAFCRNMYLECTSAFCNNSQGAPARFATTHTGAPARFATTHRCTSTFCINSHRWCIDSHRWCINSHRWCINSHRWCINSHTGGASSYKLPPKALLNRHGRQCLNIISTLLTLECPHTCMHMHAHTPTRSYTHILIHTYIHTPHTGGAGSSSQLVPQPSSGGMGLGAEKPCVWARHFEAALGRVAPSVSRKDQRCYDALRNRLASSRGRWAGFVCVCVLYVHVSMCACVCAGLRMRYKCGYCA